MARSTIKIALMVCGLWLCSWGTPEAHGQAPATELAQTLTQSTVEDLQDPNDPKSTASLARRFQAPKGTWLLWAALGSGVICAFVWRRHHR
ncbi:MAG TPA: hypothetical protein DCQ06_11910 [Myxococcales bacterium]|nr:hypothetical protein [Myxococcales bacterium]HAN32293.1 hypothetical protein [Myxococcales bacterium]